MTQSWLRILMAAYLAIWSPAVCCCGLKHVFGRVTGIEVPACGASSVVQIEHRSQPAAPRGGCCSSPADEPAAAETVTACGESPSPDQSNDDRCRCRDSIESKVRLDTGAKIIVPALAKNDLGFNPLLLAFVATGLETATVTGANDYWPPGDNHGWVRSQQTL